ncbi:MAG TPA: hypothetical protein VFB01_12655 [Burkholderiales bacterium]|nr:hypothetical protein [Burkholderiales bacterium]
MSATSRFAISVIALGLAGPGAVFAACMGPGAPANTQTKCLTAIEIPGTPLRSYDISWVNPDRAEYYLGDRSNAGIDVIDTRKLTFKRTIPGFVGVVFRKDANGNPVAVDNNHSGPDGVTSHGRWLYAGDGDSTLKVIDLDAPNASAIKQTIKTGGSTRVDEMALTTDGGLLLAANNAEDPPFATLFSANGDEPVSNTMFLSKITIADAIVPAGFGLSMEQPAWDPKTKRFYVSVPIIANNPAGCNYGQVPDADITCDGGLLVVDPTTVTSGSDVLGAFDPATNTGVVPLHACGPNGATVGVHDNILLGCTPANNPSDVTTLVINAKTKNFANIGNITGSDEVWFNKGDRRYYTASNRNCKVAGQPCPSGKQQAAVLGVIDGTSVLIETVPQSSGSHSVAADSERNLIFVPESAPALAAPPEIKALAGDNTTVGAGICGGSNGCIGVYIHQVDRDRDLHDRDRDDR